MNRLKLCIVALVALLCAGCANWKPIVRTVDDVARLFCAQHQARLQGVSVEDAWRAYCRTRDAWAPWIDPLIAAQAEGTATAQAAAASAAPVGAASTPPPPPATDCPPPPKPADSAAQPPQAAPAPAPASSASAGPPDPD